MRVLIGFIWLGLLHFYPANARVMIVNGLSHVHHTQQGGVVQGSITLKNDNSGGRVRVLVYRENVVAPCGQSVNFLRNSGDSHSLEWWLSTNVDEKVLEPNEEYNVVYTISIPEEGAEDGSYWQAIMIEAADELKKEAPKQGINISSKIRYAVQIIAQVGAVESPMIEFESVELKKEPNQMLSVNLKNSGIYFTEVNIELELYDESGNKIKTISDFNKKVYPSFCNAFSLNLSEVPEGKYVGVLVADNGIDMFSTHVTMEL